MGSDGQVLKDLVDIFLEQYPLLLREVREAVYRSDAAKLRAAAHSLKGALANLGARPAAALALQLETMGRDADLTNALDACALLEKALNRLTPALHELIAVGGRS